MAKRRKNVPMTPKAGKVPAMTQKEFDEGLFAALMAIFGLGDSKNKK